MKFILISPKNRTVYNFRGELIKEIISKGYEVIATGPNKDGLDKIEELEVRFEHIPLNKTGINLLADFKYFFKLWLLFKKEKPDITLGYTIKPIIYGAIAAKLAGVKNISSMVTGVGYVFTSKSLKAKVIRLYVSILYRIGFKCSDTVIFQNADDLKEFTKLGLLKKKKCRIVSGSGVNMQKFKPVKFPETLTFFMLSRVMFNKGIREYLQAAKKVKDNHPEVSFILLGAIENIQDSLTFNDLQPYISNGIIEYYGETDKVSDYYKLCSVYVLPSYREGMPRTVLEAMAMARPIITTDVPGCKETVIDGYNGFLVTVQDVDSLVNKMEWFVNNQDKIIEMGQASYNLCLEKFDVNNVNQKMLIYMNINLPA
jgi:glycosyltransferase involved in cell wall biosynthesis